MLRNLRSTRLLPLDLWTAMWKSCTEDRVLWKLVCSRNENLVGSRKSSELWENESIIRNNARCMKMREL